MRALVAICVLLAAACTGPAPSASGTPAAPTQSTGRQVSSGGVVEYPLSATSAPPTAIYSLPNMTRGPDGNVWFVELFSHGADNVARLARITPSGTITEFPLSGSGFFGTLAITSGPDGNLWMVGVSGVGAGPKASWIRRVTTAGVATDFALAADAAPNGITAGPDGNIWFTEPGRNKIGRITPTGQVTEFATPTAGRSPSGIAAAPDGNLWFTEYAWNSGAIARITAAGVVTEYPLPANDLRVGCGDSAMASGPDGSVWFTEPNSFGIGRVTSAGVLSEFTASGTGCVRGLTAGPDGSIWFTGGTTVGRINPSGAIRQFGLPSLFAQSAGIAVGADGRIWFSELGVNRVASIGVTVPELSLGSPLLNFGRPTASITLSVAVRNTGEAGLKIASATIVGPDSAAFAKTADDCSGRGVTAGATCHIAIRVQPSVDLGIRAARLQLVDNATGSPHSVSLVAELPDCKLPLIERSGQASAQGKLLSVVANDYSVDQTGGFTWAPDQQVYRSVNQPVLNGPDANFSYDWPLRRWLPVASQAVSPDGTRYAYSAHDSAFHVVDVATGRDRLLPGVFGNVLAFKTEGIYVTSGGGNGLWLVDPDTGAKRAILQGSGIQAVADGAAWIGVVNPDDPAPFPPGIGGGASYNQISRRDLTADISTRWFYRSGVSVQVLAAVGGRLVLASQTSAAQDVWIVNGMNLADRLTISPTGDPFPLAGNVASDATGVWLAGPEGIYLWTFRTGLILISTIKGTPAGSCS
jgi:streptogramin lyase